MSVLSYQVFSYLPSHIVTKRSEVQIKITAFVLSTFWLQSYLSIRMSEEVLKAEFAADQKNLSNNCFLSAICTILLKVNLLNCPDSLEFASGANIFYTF